MKKTLIALAALAATGAFAQSTVTLYGTLDAAVAKYSSEGVSKTGLYSSQMGSSLIGFTGSEDLGGGLKANFKLEGGLNNDNGTGNGGLSTNNQTSGVGASQAGAQGLAFNRYSYVGVSGGFGEVRLGRDYTSTFQNVVAAVDPFLTNGPANLLSMAYNLGLKNGQATTTGASNMIGYSTPAMGGFNAKVQYFMGENASNLPTAANPAGNDDGNGYSAQVGYANGPVFVSIGQMVTKGTATSATVNGDYTQRGLSASYNFGMAKVVYTYANEELIKLTATSTNKTNMLGVVVPFGAANFKASYARSVNNDGATDNVGTQLGLGVDYALSKRTVLFGTVARVTNDTRADYSAGSANLVTTGNPTSTGMAFGVKHAF